MSFSASSFLNTSSFCTSSVILTVVYVRPKSVRRRKQQYGDGVRGKKNQYFHAFPSVVGCTEMTTECELFVYIFVITRTAGCYQCGRTDPLHPSNVSGKRTKSVQHHWKNVGKIMVYVYVIHHCQQTSRGSLFGLGSRINSIIILKKNLDFSMNSAAPSTDVVRAVDDDRHS